MFPFRTRIEFGYRGVGCRALRGKNGVAESEERYDE